MATNQLNTDKYIRTQTDSNTKSFKMMKAGINSTRRENVPAIHIQRLKIKTQSKKQTNNDLRRCARTHTHTHTHTHTLTKRKLMEDSYNNADLKQRLIIPCSSKHFDKKEKKREKNKEKKRNHNNRVNKQSK